MTLHFRVVDLGTGVEPETVSTVSARTPEEAARLVTGEVLVRSGQRKDLRARVYFQQQDQPMTMVRLYGRVEDRQ